jgi:UDPglucose 6-dehydrogenase
MTMNEYQKQRFTKRIISCLFNNLSGKKLAVLGFAFKKNTSDTRESPAITLVSNFVAENARVAIYDPKVKDEQIWAELINDGGDLDNLKWNIEICTSAYDACNEADAVIVVTEWDEFSNKTISSEPRSENFPTVLGEKSTNQTVQPASKDAAKRSRAESLTTAPAFDLDKQSADSDGGIYTKDNKPPLDWARIGRSMRKPKFVFDGRGILDVAKLEELGFQVEAIGRASSASNGMRSFG